MRRLLRWFGSIRLAVPLLLAIAAVLAWGTIYEARFGTASVQRAVYQAWWFQALLAFLAANLAIAALARYPWKRQQTPFVLAHIGIILILVGGIIGGRFGIDGQLMIAEGQAEKVLQLPRNVLSVHHHASETTRVFDTDFETRAWLHEPNRTFAVPLESRTLELTVTRYYPDAALREEILEGGDEDAARGGRFDDLVHPAPRSGVPDVGLFFVAGDDFLPKLLQLGGVGVASRTLQRGDLNFQQR
jgi:hypothetical protein